MNDECRILDVNNHISFKRKIEAINWCTAKDYDNSMAWQPACWPSNRPKSSDFRIWFPRLSSFKNGKYVAEANNCVNYLSDDWEYFYFDDLLERHKSGDPSDWYLGPDLIFAKDVDGDYVFRGVYKTDIDKSRPNHFVSKRIATRVKLIGKPVQRFELLNSIEVDSIDDINIPKKPKNTIRKIDGSIQYVCGHCEKSFMKALRCPECGQLVKE